MNRTKSRGRRDFRPLAEACEPRTLLSGSGPFDLSDGSTLGRPNIPVAPFGAPSTTASFIDPSVRVVGGTNAEIGEKSLIGPYVSVDSRHAYLVIGDGSAILDNATLSTVDAPGGQAASILIGSNVVVGFGATIEGGSLIGSLKPGTESGSTTLLPTSIGPNALIDGATIEPGAIVSGLAKVGPGITIPAGFVVLPGVNVTTEAQATEPSLGMVRAITPADQAFVTQQLAHDALLAQGYATLYDGSSATGASPGVPSSVKNVYNGDLTTVTGASAEPGSANGVTFEPAKNTTPQFQSPTAALAPGTLYTFPARVTGEAYFSARPKQVSGQLGKANAIRADDGQPIRFASAPSTGNAITITSPIGSNSTTNSSGVVTQTTGGALDFGQSDRLDQRAVVLGGPSPTTTVTTTVATSPASTTTTTVTTTPSGTITNTTKDSTTPTTTTTTTSSITNVAAPTYTIGDDVTIGRGAVVDRSNIGSGAIIGSRSFIQGSTVAAGAVIAPGTILVNNKLRGTIQW